MAGCSGDAPSGSCTPFPIMGMHAVAAVWPFLRHHPATLICRSYQEQDRFLKPTVSVAF